MEKTCKTSRCHTAWFIWLAAVIFYFYEFFVRVAPGGMFQDMRQHYAVTAGLLGFASSIYYYIYSPIQIFAGTLFDRFGGRSVLISANLCVTLGCIGALLSSHSLMIFALGRFLMGLGSGFGFIGVMYLAAIWFPKGKISFISGLTTAAGFLGAIFALEYIPQLIEWIGYFPCWLLASILGILSTLILYIAIPHASLGEKERWEAYRKAHVEHHFFTGLFQVLRNPQTWIIGSIAGAFYAIPTVFGDLWGNAYLEIVAGVSNKTAGQTVAMLYIGWLIGSPFFGWLSDRIQKKKIFLLWGSLIGSILLCVFLYSPLSLNATRILLLLIGFCGSPQVTCFTASLEINPSYASGSAVAVVNMIVMFIGGFTQPIVGWIINGLTQNNIRDSLHMASAHDLRIALSVLPIIMFLGFIMTLFYDERSVTTPS